MSVLPLVISVHTVCAWYLQMSEEDISSLGTGVASHGGEQPHGYWEPNPGPMQE